MATAFSFTEIDLELSMRLYLLTQPIRPANSSDTQDRVLTELYAGMLEDTIQHGVRIGDLYLEEKIPSYPSIGILSTGMIDFKPGSVHRRYAHAFFLDAICRVNDSKGGIDRIATRKQHLNLMTDLRLLLCELQSDNIPLYRFNDNNTTTLVGSIKIFHQNPSVQITTSPRAQSYSLLGIHADFRTEVFLIDSW